MNKCIIWEGPVWSQGRYGMVVLNGVNMTAHRAAWIKKFGPIPKEINVSHKCDNELCVNTNHLFLGTRKENMQDCKEKGRGGWKKDGYEKMKKANLDISSKLLFRLKKKTLREGTTVRGKIRQMVLSYVKEQ